MKNFKNNHTLTTKLDAQGFTLVELLIYMGLLTIFVYILSSMLISILDVKTESEAISAVEQDGRFLMERFAYDISRASSISTPASPGSSGSGLELVIGGVTYTYSLNGSNLELTNNNGTDNLNSSEVVVSSVTFQRLGNPGGKNSIKIEISLASLAERDGGPETKIFNITAGGR